MDIAVSNRVVARNGIGRFLADCDQAGTDTIEEAVEDGANLSRGFAPEGHKFDRRTIDLSDSIKTRMIGSKAGEWVATARHALPQETGSVAHPITGKLSFLWENEGRWFEPPWDGGDATVNHPGNPPKPYLRPAYEIIMGRIMEIAREKYP